MTNKKVPMRQCVGCNEMKSKREMIRVIKTAEEEVLWIQPARRTEEVLTFVLAVSVWKKQERAEDWNVL